MLVIRAAINLLHGCRREVFAGSRSQAGVSIMRTFIPPPILRASGELRSSSCLTPR